MPVTSSPGSKSIGSRGRTAPWPARGPVTRSRIRLTARTPGGRSAGGPG
jgi:hypothetical protein